MAKVIYEEPTLKNIFILSASIWLFCLISCSQKPSVIFEVISDQNIDCNNLYLPTDIVDNCIIAKLDNKIITKYYSANVNILKIESVKNNVITVQYKINDKQQFHSDPFWDSGKIILYYKNGEFIQVIKYPENKGIQSGPIFRLLQAKINNEFIKLKYDYQQYSDARAAGFGTVDLVFNKLENDVYYFSDYEFNVFGYFTKAIGYSSSDDTKGEEALVPDENGKEIIKKNISKKEIARQFAEILTDVWYDSVEINSILIVSENLRLREGEEVSSKIVTTMKANTQVIILKIGKSDVIEGFPGNWCYIEIVEDIFKKNESYDFWELVEQSKPTGVKGWCFSAYLK